MNEEVRGQHHPLAPEFAWEIPVTPVRLVSAALSAGRPGGLAERRLNGLSDSEVASRYGDLRELVLADLGAASLSRLEDLERSEPETPASRWETWVASSGAAQRVEVVRAARRLWEALGPNEYARSLKQRPRTSRGFVEGRLWLVSGAVPPVLFIMWGIAALEGWQRAALAAAAVAWPLAVAAAFLRRRRGLVRVGDAELPHL